MVRIFQLFFLGLLFLFFSLFAKDASAQTCTYLGIYCSPISGLTCGNAGFQAGCGGTGYSCFYCTAATPVPTATPTPAPACSCTGTWSYSCGCTAADGSAGHYATCSNWCNSGSSYTDPTCYAGTSVCPTPTPTPTCPQITCGGNPGAGGTCTYPTSPNVNVGSCSYTCPGSTKTVPGYTISVCQSNNCYANSCQCYPNDPNACNTGHTVTNQTCVGGNWQTTGSSCALTCPTPPPCDTNCGACGVGCGTGLQLCTGSSTGQTCTPTNKSCTNVCPNGQQCKQNFCVASDTIAGSVFIDLNKNGIKDPGEQNYTGAITIGSTGGSVTTGSGSYTVNGLLDGSYTVSLTSGAPSGYAITYPNGQPPSFTVTVGASCNTNGALGASCSNGSISNLNFGISNTQPWIQIIGNDGRIDAGFNDPIPAGATCGSYASVPGSQSAPGLIFSGASSYSFGQGQASQNPYNWITGGFTYPESYGPVKNGGLVKTGFSFLQSKASQAGLTITDISTYCSGGIANCTLSAVIPHGVYIANGNMTLVGSGFTFPSGQNYVILVNGDLTIKEKVLVPNGSTAIFSASGNINVDKSVGESSISSTASDLEGVYSADKNFTVQGTNNCSTGTDLRLNVVGAVITNAAGGGGSLQNQRDLCGGDLSCPAFSSIARPDLILNTPDFMKQANFTYQEIAP